MSNEKCVYPTASINLYKNSPWNIHNGLFSLSNKSVFNITNYTEQSPWEANSHSASQEISRHLSNSKVHSRVHNSPLISKLCVIFRNRLLLRWVVSPLPNPQEWGPHLACCQLLLTQHILSYPPYPEAVSYTCNPRMCLAVVTET
jgi:hypothetical protein